MKIDHENVIALVEEMEFVYSYHPNSNNTESLSEEETRNQLIMAINKLVLETGTRG